jgi:hypothetical protein
MGSLGCWWDKPKAAVWKAEPDAAIHSIDHFFPSDEHELMVRIDYLGLIDR